MVGPEVQQIVENAVDAYAEALRSDPVPTKMLTAALMVALGDAVSQVTEARGKDVSFDAQRGMSLAVFGAVYTGAFQHWWFLTLNDAISVPEDASAAQLWLVAATKTCLCQFGTIPLVYIPLFFALTGALRGLTLEQNLQRARDLYEPLLRRNISYWLPVQMAQFLWVDESWQVPYVCTAGFVWSIILSGLTGRISEKKEEEEEEGHNTHPLPNPHSVPEPPMSSDIPCLRGVARLRAQEEYEMAG